MGKTTMIDPKQLLLDALKAKDASAAILMRIT